MKKVLLVEDDPDDAALITRMLREAGLEETLDAVTDGQQAVDRLLAPGAALPGVVILDLKLPKLDGIQVLTRLRADARTKLLPVVILTSSGEDADIGKAYAPGANSVVQKPVDFDQFRESLRLLGRYWMSLNQRLPASGEGR